MNGKILKKMAAISLAAMFVTGGVPVQPIADIASEFSLTASAATYAYNSTVNLTACSVGDVFEAGATLINNTNNVLRINGLDDCDELAVGEPYDFTQRCRLTSKTGMSLTFTVIGLDTTEIITQPDLNTPIIYDGTAKNIISSAADVSGGQIVYYGVSSSASSRPTSWSANYESITATNKGTYYIWLKTDGNTSYNALMPTRLDSTVIISDQESVFENCYFGNSNGSQSDPFIINDTEDWDYLCEAMKYSNIFHNISGKYFKLANNITVSNSVGLGTNAFCGTFDGNGKTLTFNYSGSDDFIAPFASTTWNTNPVFHDLTVKGTINSTGSYAAGLIGHLYGNVTIENCKSDIDITSAGGSGGFVGLCEHTVNFTNCMSSTVIHSEGGNNSGFVGWSRASGRSISFTGCIFNGKILQQNGSGGSNGGFIGWTGSNKTVTINNSICAPAAIANGETMATGNSATFARGWNATTTATNSYYITAFGNAQAKKAHTVTAGANTTVGFGTATDTYNVSGISAYNTGLSYGGKFYAGNGDSVVLTLDYTPDGGTFEGYTVNAGTLNGNVLTMPDQDVTVTADINYGSYFDRTTGTLYLKGDLKKYGNSCIRLPKNVIIASVKHIAVDPAGAKFPQDSSNLFRGFKCVKTIDLTGADTSGVTNMSCMFCECESLTTLEFGGIRTRSVTDMSSMFYKCRLLQTLDLSMFNTWSLTNTRSMFAECEQLRTIYGGREWSMSNVETCASENMFYNCTRLVGEKGTRYSKYFTDKSYARFDSECIYGYLSRKH